MNKKKPVTSRNEKPAPKNQTEGGSVEERLLQGLLEPLRTTERREQSLAATQGSHETIEKALASPFFLGGVAKAQNAFVVEHWPSLLRKLFAAAEEGESWAWKILLDVAGVAEQLRVASGDEDLGLRAELDATLPEEIRALMRTTHAEPAHSGSSETNS